MNGELIAKTRAYSLADVEIVVSTVDLEDIRQYRNSIRSWTRVAASTAPFPRIQVDFALSSPHDVVLPSCTPIEWTFHTPEEEIALGPACWLWDYLRYDTGLSADEVNPVTHIRKYCLHWGLNPDF